MKATKKMVFCIIYFMTYLVSHSLVSGSCKTVLNGTKGDIISPGYPNSYYSNAYCTWTIVAPAGSKITLQFSDFLVEKNYLCRSDVVKVYDGSSDQAAMIGKYCGRFNPFAVTSSGHTLFILFTSDEFNNYKGFQASFMVEGTSIGRAISQLLATKTPSMSPSISHKGQPSPTTLLPQPLVFTRILKNNTAFVGDRRLILKCEIKRIKRLISIVWTKNGERLNESVNIIFRKHNTKRSNKFRLRIRHILEQHSGWYGCHVSDNSGKVIHSYGFLKVQEGMQKPKIKNWPVNFAAVKRSLVELNCTADGLPKPRIRWKINKSYVADLQHENDTVRFLVMKNVSVTCEAKNSLGRDTKTVTVTLAPELSKPRITRAPNNWTVELGENVTLTCTATGNPMPVIRWEIDGRYYPTPDENGTISHTFKVLKQTAVACIAQNRLGVDSRAALVDFKRSGVTQAKRVGPLKQNHLIILTAGAGVLCIVVVVIYFMIKRRHKAKFTMQHEVKSDDLLQNPIFEDQSRSRKSSNNSRLEKWELPRNSIEFVSNLEDGPITHIFLGNINHPNREQLKELVMVKVLKETNPSFIVRETFDAEAFAVATYSHINVQSLVGVCAVSTPFCMVFEYADHKNLNSFLRDCDSPSHYVLRQRSDTNRSYDNVLKLSGLDLLSMSRQIAAGMEYLADAGHIHKQLCTMNCIIGNSLNVKISGIGISWSHPSTSYYKLDARDRGRYPVRWYPPETIQYGAFSEDTDKWSFGVVLWELHSFGLEPYYGMSNEEVISLVREGDVLPCPKDCPQEIYELMRDCWNLTPTNRPRFSSLHQRISAIYSPIAV